MRIDKNLFKPLILQIVIYRVRQIYGKIISF